MFKKDLFERHIAVKIVKDTFDTPKFMKLC